MDPVTEPYKNRGSLATIDINDSCKKITAKTMQDEMGCYLGYIYNKLGQRRPICDGQKNSRFAQTLGKNLRPCAWKVTNISENKLYSTRNAVRQLSGSFMFL